MTTKDVFDEWSVECHNLINMQKVVFIRRLQMGNKDMRKADIDLYGHVMKYNNHLHQ